jgi:hypothetical protein
MKCERCSARWGDQAVARLCSEIIDIAVCLRCAKEACDLGFACEPPTQPTAKRLATAA